MSSSSNLAIALLFLRYHTNQRDRMIPRGIRVITTRGKMTAGRIMLRRVEERVSTEGSGSLNVALKSRYPSAGIYRSLFTSCVWGREVIITSTK